MHDLVVAAGWNHAGRRRLRAVLETHHHLDLGAERLLVELDRLLAAAVEEQIGCRHGLLSFVHVVWDVQVVWGSCCDRTMVRGQPVCARRRAAISILRICSIERMTRAEFSFFIISGSAFGMTCHERPNLSLSHPHGPSLPSFTVLCRLAPEVVDLLLRFAVNLERHGLVELEMRAAVERQEFLP